MIYNRQKALMSLMYLAHRPLGRTELVKWAFMLRQELGPESSVPFYDFLPYRFGPFSFALYKDLSDLVQKGYIDEATLSLDDARIGEIVDGFDSLHRKCHESLERTVSFCIRRSPKRLIEFVYDKYPWYASRSELQTSTEHGNPLAQPAIFTSGYEGESIDSFFNELLRRGIRGIIDVRSNPISRKYGFSKSVLIRVSEKLGLRYSHFPELGIPSSVRQGVTSHSDVDRILAWYRVTVLPRAEADCLAAGDLMAARPTTLLCYEREPNNCHRSRLASAISLNTGLDTIHIN